MRVWMVILKKGKNRSEVHMEYADSVRATTVTENVSCNLGSALWQLARQEEKRL